MPSQQELDSFYSSGAYWHAASGHSQLAHAATQARVRLSACLPYLHPERPVSVADIGAGNGFIGRELARSGLAVSRYECVEPDDKAIAHTDTFELPFSLKRVRTIDELGSGFSLFFLNQVIEHVADPIPLLERVLARATRGSIVHVETPNSDYKFKSDVFPHTLFYSSQALEYLGNRLSLETLRCETFGLWPAPKLTGRGLMQRVASRAMAASSKLGPSTLSSALDRFIWRYETVGRDTCIWLRWIFRVSDGRG
jgi:2-polyprenyl-3-methyl-5-hydroxy-6-metoxy-1,4-benzoquinol methylase